MKKIRNEAADAVLALRNLCLAVCRERADGAELLNTISGGRLRIVLDEPAGQLVVGIRPEDGERVQWVETIDVDPGDERHFGTLVSTAVAASGRTH